jgi:hypothetical protein
MIGINKQEPMTAFILLRLRSAAAALTKGVALQSGYISFLNLELMTGIEPVTSPLPRECSTN